VSDVFISYARSTAGQAGAVAEALRGRGYDVWLDDDLPAHRVYSEVIEERLKTAKAVVVIWSAEAAKSEWVQSEADRARAERKLVQLTIDGAALPMPFDRIQCADLAGWAGDIDAPGWRKVVDSIGELVGGRAAVAPVETKASLALPSKPSIAVLPFTDMTGAEGQDYFADGMVVEIVAALSRIKSIFVIASGSTLSLKGKGLSPQEAARLLGVRYVLEGSFRKAGGRVRIAVQLIDAADGRPIWTHRFEDILEDVFALQDKVALAVAGKIEPTVQEAEIRRASARPTENMGAYDLYLRAVPLARTYAKEGILEALDLLNRALSLDPHYGSALALAGRCHFIIAAYGWSDDLESHRRDAVALAHRALKAAGDDAYVLAAAAGILGAMDRDQVVALALIEKAIALNPGSAFAWFISGSVRMVAGETDLAFEHLETSKRLDPMGPLGPAVAGYMGVVRFKQGRFAEAVPYLRESVQQADIPTSFAYLAASYGKLGETAAAQAALARFAALSPLPIDVHARSTIIRPNQLELFLEGIALAEGKAPSKSGEGS